MYNINKTEVTNPKQEDQLGFSTTKPSAWSHFTTIRLMKRRANVQFQTMVQISITPNFSQNDHYILCPSIGMRYGS